MAGDYLLRTWGADAARVAAIRPPDAREREDGPLCYWFDTAEEREAFIASLSGITNAVRDRVNPGPDSDGEDIDTVGIDAVD